MIPIAIYHCNIGIVSRGKGKSAVAAAAYRSGEKITNEWDGMTHDYTRKRGVVHTEILLPPHAPPSFSDRSTLWNSVELYEKAGNAQLAREIDAALPIESVSYTHLDDVYKRQGEVISLTIDEVYLFQKYLASHSITLMADDQKLPCICFD